MILREKDKIEIIKLVKNSLSGQFRVLVFGSRVNGKAHETSDLDLAIDKNGEKIALEELYNLKEKIKYSNIPIIIQILDFNRLPESFKINILKNYEILI